MQENPLKTLRLSKSWTLDDIANSTGCSRHLIIRAEQGCYDRVPPRLMRFYVDRFYIDSAELNEQLRTFQVETRKVVGRKLFKLGEAELWQGNPITQLREWDHLSKAQVTKGLCLHPTIIHKLEKEPHRYNDLPTQFIDALYDAGYYEGWINGLSRRWVAFKLELSGAIQSGPVGSFKEAG